MKHYMQYYEINEAHPSVEAERQARRRGIEPFSGGASAAERSYIFPGVLNLGSFSAQALESFGQEPLHVEPAPVLVVGEESGGCSCGAGASAALYAPGAWCLNAARINARTLCRERSIRVGPRRLPLPAPLNLAVACVRVFQREREQEACPRNFATPGMKSPSRESNCRGLRRGIMLIFRKCSSPDPTLKRRVSLSPVKLPCSGRTERKGSPDLLSRE